MKSKQESCDLLKNVGSAGGEQCNMTERDEAGGGELEENQGSKSGQCSP